MKRLMQYLQSILKLFSRIRFPALLFRKKRAAPAPAIPPIPEPLKQPSGPIVVRQDEQHPSEAYMDLKRRFRDAGRLTAIAETMGRDFLTAMPEGAWKSRLGQIVHLHRRRHEDLSDPELARQVDRAESHLANHPEDWDEWDRVNLEEMRRIATRTRYVDSSLTERETRLAYEGRRQHRYVLATGDWMQGREFLGKTVDTKRQIAEALCQGTGSNQPYEVLLDEFQPGLKLTDVERWFGKLQTRLGDMVPKIMDKQANEPQPLDITDFYPAKAQMWLNTALLKSIGFDFERGGLYETGHNPVEGGTPDDTRLVIRSVDTTNFMDSMKSALHEGGHGVYIQGLPRKTWRYQPVAQDLGASIHESQALLVEMIMARTRAFFEFLSPRVEGLFHGLQNPVLSADNLDLIKTRVKPVLNRKNADEVTYFFHVLLRFRLERDLIEGRLKLVDLPEAWNAQMEQLLNIRPDSHANGCLQDVHWFVGKFGYFPSYTVGHMMAAQQFHTIKKDIPDVLESIRAGDFMPAMRWAGEKIHSKGRLMGMKELMKNATGKDISPDYLINHLEDRYLKAA